MVAAAAAAVVPHTLAVLGLALCLVACGVHAADPNVKLLSRVSNDLIPKLFKNLPGSKEDNLVFSSIGLLQNLAVLAELSSSADVKNELVKLANLTSRADLEQIKQQFHTVLKTFESESVEGENSTNAAGLFNYLNTNPEHKLRPEVEERLARDFRTNVSYDTSLEGGWFSASADTGVLSHWRELEALAVFTFLQHSAAAPFRLNNGSTRNVPLVPQIGRFETRDHEHYSLVKLPLQATSTKLVLIMPKSAAEFSSFVENMPAMEELLAAGEARDMEVWFPQLLAISSLEFKPVLEKLGVRAIFQADLSSVTGSAEPLRLSSVSQKSFFSTSFNSIKSITESGAHFTAVEARRRRRREAVEATTAATAAAAESSPSLVFNQPFVFLIERVDLGLVLTAGCVNDPTQFPQQP